MTKYIKLLRVQLTEKRESTAMEANIFHLVCKVILSMLTLSLLINLITQIPYVSAVLCGTFLLIGILYYNSRYLGNLKSSTLLFSLSLQAVLLLNYFINSGIQGPTLILLLLSLIFTMAVMPNKQYVFWIAANVALVSCMLGIQYFYPQLIRGHYYNRARLFIDVAFSYFVAVLSISLVLTYILRRYEAEKNSAVTALQELKKANESKAKLLSILSHDLKAPLNSIQGFLEILLEYDLEEKEKRVIKKSLLEETKNTQVMLFNMLAWTKTQMDAGLQVSLQPVELQEVLKVTIALQQVAAMEKMITIQTDIDPVCIQADADMIQVVVRNLLNNAIKFTRSGGEILLTIKRDNDQGVLTVKDNGIGISVQKQQELFTVTPGTTYGTSNEKGVGLGLMLCKEFTELQGGKISFKSTLGEGTEFYLSLPLCDSGDDNFQQVAVLPINKQPVYH